MAVVTVHVPLPQLPACLVLLTAAPAVAVPGVCGRLRPLAVLLVVPVVLVMAVLPGAAMQLSVNNQRSPLGVVHGLKVAVVFGVDDVALWHHLQVGSDPVVTGATFVTEVDHAAFVGPFIGRFDPGEAEFVGDVAANDLHNLDSFKEKKKT